MNITSGKIPRAQRIVVYGPEGIGKSTFASQFPKPVFIDTEGSTEHLDVARTPKPNNWLELISQIQYFIDNDTDYSTLVIDTIDWAEKLCIKNLLSEHSKSGIEDFGYGQGYVYLYESMDRFLAQLEVLRNKGMNILFLAHSMVKRHDLPEETGSYDRYELKLERKTTPLIKEWVDMILFCNYEIYVVEDKGSSKKKATGGTRVIHTSPTPYWSAKNRHALSEKLKMEFSEIAHCIPGQKIDQNAFNSELYDLMKTHSITAEEIQELVASAGHYTADVPLDNYDQKFIQEKIIGSWEAFHNAIITRRNK